jgi:CTP synthase
MATKYIFVTGGVCSSLGKGITTASIGTLLKTSGFNVFTQKLDPYINVDPGTMSPFQHGEVFVTDDGAETDLDLGHYERFIDTNLSAESSVSTGKIYSKVIAEERKGTYLGGTIQIIPHVTDEIKRRIKEAGKKSRADIVLCEIGGTVGDIEGQPFIEALRQMRHDVGIENTMYVHLTLLPYLKGSKELKTKPTQASVRELRGMGIIPDFIVARADQYIAKDLLKKISRFCDVPNDHVIPGETVNSIYEVPIKYQEHNFAQLIANKLNLGKVKPDLKEWKSVVDKILKEKAPLKIALVGKYTHLEDAYISVIESLKIACYHQNRELELDWIDSEKLEENDEKTWKKLKEAAGIVVPGGFGIRGTEGKIAAAKYCRENNIPYLGLCLGMQIMSIEFARYALNDNSITSEEFDEKGKIDKEKYIIHFLPGQSAKRAKGGTLRLGAYPCKLMPRTKTKALYNKNVISERHRHRYEFNNKFRKKLENKGFVISGVYEKENLVEIAEIKNHPFMIGSQFHPEFKSRPNRPHPLFYGFIETSINTSK